MKISSILLFIFSSFLFSCSPPRENNRNSEADASYSFKVREFEDSEYPDNPDIGFRSVQYLNEYFSLGEIIPDGKGQYTLQFISRAEIGDTITFRDIDLMEFIPTLPEKLKDRDPYLSQISLINQEFNRNQVRFGADKFHSNRSDLSRADIARNCLNAYLWEVILFKQEKGKELPVSHGWFQFPPSLYQQLFEEKNGLEFTRYGSVLEHWVDLPSKTVDRTLLRETIRPLKVSWEDLSDGMYPLKGARKKKFKEIVYPPSFRSMRDLQQDSTLFATFSPPGIYDRSNPKTTELGRFYSLDSLRLSLTRTGTDTLQELELFFRDKLGERVTRLTFGGMDPAQFPRLSPDQANAGWKNSMGIGNHPFYEQYTEHLAWKCAVSPWYGFLSDEHDRWLDSHKIGIDGPVFHFDADDHRVLHLWLLSFERHALVGHYRIRIEDKGVHLCMN